MLILWKRLRFNSVRADRADPIKEAGMARLPTPSEGILLTHFIVSDDVERSRCFYTEVLLFPFSPPRMSLPENRPDWKLVSPGGKL
jgi:hypothetical protein